jgi:2-succinyl-5-enolpyruvyl-6-hydroxy-3-cyclohexene-1-carboxylate synthase
MHPAASAHGFAVALIGGFADLGLTDVVISPGSRNTPLTAAFASHPAVTDWSVLDERSAGFFALGMAKASGRPVALVCTSGTAAAEYHPAVVEAHLARVPLLVLTADRPDRQRDVGAPQAIDQVKLYGEAVRWFHQGSVPGPASAAGAPHLSAHAWALAVGIPPGPVHLNLPFEDSLVLPAGAPAPPPTPPTPSVASGVAVPDLTAVAGIDALVGGKRVVAVVGALAPVDAKAVAGLATALRIPVLADPQSGLRGEDKGAVLASGDLLATVGMLDRMVPEAVLRFGAPLTSKAVTTWLAANSRVPQVVVDPAGWRDPTASAALVVRADPHALAAALATTRPAPEEWADGWHRADGTAQSVLDEAIAAEPFPNEPAIARAVFAGMPDHGLLYASSSMPIRDVDAFGGHRRDGSSATVLANRGANGIDGVISSALGAAASGRPVTALVGDVAALHDLNALATTVRLDLPLTVVVVHNDGGGIFSFLPQADPARFDPQMFERHLGTPHGTNFGAVATALGMKVENVDTAAALTDLVAAGTGPTLVEVRSGRAENVALHARLVQAVRTALE